jgi:hypothetical protein
MNDMMRLGDRDRRGFVAGLGDAFEDMERHRHHHHHHRHHHHDFFASADNNQGSSNADPTGQSVGTRQGRGRRGSGGSGNAVRSTGSSNSSNSGQRGFAAGLGDVGRSIGEHRHHHHHHRWEHWLHHHHHRGELARTDKGRNAFDHAGSLAGSKGRTSGQKTWNKVLAMQNGSGSSTKGNGSTGLSSKRGSKSSTGRTTSKAQGSTTGTKTSKGNQLARSGKSTTGRTTKASGTRQQGRHSVLSSLYGGQRHNQAHQAMLSKAFSHANQQARHFSQRGTGGGGRNVSNHVRAYTPTRATGGRSGGGRRR